MSSQSNDDLILAEGHTSVFLIVNMDAFIEREDRDSLTALERFRATDDLQNLVQHEWPEAIAANPLFKRVDPPIEETGYLTGVFRRKMISRFSAPEYRFDKEAFKQSEARFSDDLMRNYQFRRLMFRRRNVWNKWDIYIRPAMTGMFVLRFECKYPMQPISTIFRYTVDIQECFDLNDAINHLDRLHELYDTPEKREKSRSSVNALLDWLRVDKNNLPDPPYIPVQWQLALEVCNQFINSIDKCIEFESEERNFKLELCASPYSAVEQLHDSFMVYHLDRVSTRWSYKNAREIMETHQEIFTKDIKTRNDRWDFAKHFMITKVRQEIYNLMEGALLSVNEQKSEEEKPSQRLYFPQHSREHVDDFFKNDIATWEDELCLLNSRTALIMPSHSTKEDEAALYISSLPTPSFEDSNISYVRYWKSVERLMEFVTEIRVLAQILEQSSSYILQDFGSELRRMRSQMLDNDVKFRRDELIRLINDSANLVRLVGLCHNLSNTSVWSRAEFAMEKGEYLMDQMRVQESLKHTERNLGHISNLVDHIDELYLADLSEDNNNLSLFTSVILSSVSFSLILFTLPSFWIDSNALNNASIDSSILEFTPSVIQFGTYRLAPVILFLSAALFIVGSIRLIPYLWKKFKIMLGRLYRRFSGK